jgi:hypothetical protein
VQGLKSAKEIWDVLKTAHEGDEVTKITKRETIEGELGRFILNLGEEPQVMYNRLKTLVNQVRNLGSTKWDDHEMVKVILRSLVFRNPTQVRCSRWSDGDKTGRDTLRSIRHQTKACDEVIPPCGLVQLRGPRAIRPIVTGPAWPLRVTGLICKGIPVITVCNPALWEYSGDNLGV